MEASYLFDGNCDGQPASRAFGGLGELRSRLPDPRVEPGKHLRDDGPLGTRLSGRRNDGRCAVSFHGLCLSSYADRSLARLHRPWRQRKRHASIRHPCQAGRRVYLGPSHYCRRRKGANSWGSLQPCQLVSPPVTNTASAAVSTPTLPPPSCLYCRPSLRSR